MTDLYVESEESNDVPSFTWSVSKRQSRASTQVNIFTAEPIC